MRDKNKNTFRSNIKEINEAINDAKERMKRVENNSRKEALSRTILSDLFDRTITLFSVGDSKEIVRESLLETIQSFEDNFYFDDGFGDMDKMIWIISLSILCDIDLENFEKITSVIKRDNVQDKLIDFLIKGKDDSWEGNSNSYIQKHPYASVNEFLIEEDTEIVVNKIKNYLNKTWYNGHEESHWHGTLESGNLGYYFGYWSWEAAAIAKIKGIDDSSLQNQKYYPYDAVHW